MCDENRRGAPSATPVSVFNVSDQTTVRFLDMTPDMAFQCFYGTT